MDKKTMIIIAVAIVVVAVLFSMPCLKGPCKLPKCLGGKVTILEIQKGELYSKDDSWHMPYEIKYAGRPLLSGEMVAERIVAPVKCKMVGDDLILVFKGIKLPEKTAAK